MMMSSHSGCKINIGIVHSSLLCTIVYKESKAIKEMTKTRLERKAFNKRLNLGTVILSSMIRMEHQMTNWVTSTKSQIIILTTANYLQTVKISVLKSLFIIGKTKGGGSALY